MVGGPGKTARGVGVGWRGGETPLLRIGVGGGGGGPVRGRPCVKNKPIRGWGRGVDTTPPGVL